MTIGLFFKFYGYCIVSGLFWGFAVSFLLLCLVRLFHRSGIPKGKGIGAIERMAWYHSDGSLLGGDQREHSADEYK